MPLRNFIFGSELPLDEFSKRKTLLASYYFLISIGVRVFFAFVNLFNPKGATDMRMLLGGILFSTICLGLLRYGWINTSIVAHLIFSNVLAFLFTYPDPDQYLTGTYLFFIPSILWALAIFGYQQRWVGIGFSIVSISLFLISLFDWKKFHFADAHFFFVTNFVITTIIGMLILTYYNREVFHSEQSLMDKNTELKKTNVELDRFAYSASHDLRAPISSLLGLIKLYQISPANEKDKMVDLMESRVRKLDDFVREIIQYSKNARLEVNPSEFLPFDLVNGCWDRLRFMSYKSKIQFINHTDPVLHLYHDAERIRTVIENLISNGIKYSKPRPEPSYITINVFLDSGFLCIEVADNGIGIEMSKHDKVFEMFYRAHDNSDGSGLGLYIVKEMINKMQGEVSLTSDESGTTFKIRIPEIAVPKPVDVSSATTL